jgi:L-ascorbate metabolism protein UlaG (beta-lactamase superfamily)
MATTLDWLGCATYRLTIGGLVVFLDTFMDRTSTAPAVGMTTADVDRADWLLIGHSHWDHIAGADVIAKRTGAKVIGSHETARVLRERGVPGDQLLPAQGGEHFRLSDDVTVRVYPSLHSCIWARMGPPGAEVTGDLGLTEDERAARQTARAARDASARPDVIELRELIASGADSRSTGGALDYLIQTPEGSILYQDTMGYWSGIYGALRPNVALLAAAGRGNIDGEPIQGSIEDFVAGELELLRPRQVALNHHDNFTGAVDRPDVTDISPIRERLAAARPELALTEMGLGERIALFAD